MIESWKDQIEAHKTSPLKYCVYLLPFRGKLLQEVIQSWNDQIEAHKAANRKADAILAEERQQFQALVEANKKVRTG